MYREDFVVSNIFPDTDSTIRITGHGTVNVDNTRNQVQQTHSGPLVWNAGLGTTILSYEVDTNPGSSGSPIIWNTNQHALGIHTNGGCTASGGANDGTAFNNLGLKLVVDTVVNGAIGYESTNTIHVDIGAQLPNAQTGSLFRPRINLTAAHNAANAGNKISLMAGEYNNDTPLLNKPVLIVAPVGTAVIGQ